MVLTDRVPNCLLQAMERQEWFSFTISTDTMHRYFGTRRININADFLESTIPLIREKYGGDQELEVKLRITDPRIIFSKGESNILLSADVEYGVRLAEESSYLF